MAAATLSHCCLDGVTFCFWRAKWHARFGGRLDSTTFAGAQRISPKVDVMIFFIELPARSPSLEGNANDHALYYFGSHPIAMASCDERLQALLEERKTWATKGVNIDGYDGKEEKLPSMSVNT